MLTKMVNVKGKCREYNVPLWKVCPRNSIMYLQIH